jgi:aminopeptidase-like protein
MPKQKVYTLIAKIVMWPNCQECMGRNCPHSFFLDLVIDNQGTNYICTNQGDCEIERIDTQVDGKFNI